MIHLVEYIGAAACYEALAEECVELAHAALKQARMLRGENPVGDSYTSVDIQKKLEEESTDVLLMLEELGLDRGVLRWQIYSAKRDRTLKRLEEAGIEQHKVA